MEWFTLTLLVTPALAAWRPAPGVPANRQTGTGSGSGCPYEAHTQTCNETQIDCDAGYYGDGCWYGNYCLQQIQEWDGCPGVCSTNCNWETEDYCSYEPDSNGCWMGNWCQDKSMGGCPEPGTGSGTGSGTASGSGSCYDPYTQECNATEIYCDSGMDPEGCWYGNYCLQLIQALAVVLVVALPLALAAAMIHTHRNAMLLRSPVTPGCPLKDAGMAITVSNRSRNGMAALVSAPPTVTGRLRTTVPMSQTVMDAGWGTGVRIRVWEAALTLAAPLMVTALGLVPALSTLHRCAMRPRYTVTQAAPLKVAGMATTALTRPMPMTAVRGSAHRTVTGKWRIGVIWALTLMAAGWVTGARTGVLEAARLILDLV